MAQFETVKNLKPYFLGALISYKQASFIIEIFKIEFIIDIVKILEILCFCNLGLQYLHIKL